MMLLATWDAMLLIRIGNVTSRTKFTKVLVNMVKVNSLRAVNIVVIITNQKFLIESCRVTANEAPLDCVNNLSIVIVNRNANVEDFAFVVWICIVTIDFALADKSRPNLMA